MHIKSLYVRARPTKTCCALPKFTEKFAAVVYLQDFDEMHFL